MHSPTLSLHLAMYRQTTVNFQATIKIHNSAPKEVWFLLSKILIS